MLPDQDELDGLVHRIIEVVKPLRIILFGSAARGEMGPDSDLDVLVVMPDGPRRLDTALMLHERITGFRVAVDYIVATADDLRKYGNTPGFVYRDALREGRELYASR